jgi:hypothetical protein
MYISVEMSAREANQGTKAGVPMWIRRRRARPSMGGKAAVVATTGRRRRRAKDYTYATHIIHTHAYPHTMHIYTHLN